MPERAINYDVAIVGGGMVGGALALAMADSPYRVALIDPQAPQALQSGSYDERSTALSYASVQWLKSMGVWPALSSAGAAIEQVHVSQLGHLGTVRLEAAAQGVSALGYVLPNRAIVQALYGAVQACGRTDLLPETRVSHLSTEQDGCELVLDEGRARLHARLVLAVDGSQSFVRQTLGIACREYDYQQAAVIANMSPECAHRQRAFERFTPSGPLALLPLPSGRCNVVYSVWREDLERVMGLSDAAFCAEIQSLFGQRLGRLHAPSARLSFPLKLLESERLCQGRVVFMGNAARTLHPVAGQGFNLGLRDVAEWRECVRRQAPSDIGDRDFLKHYVALRQRDQRATIRMTDFFARSFRGRNRALGHMRGLGLMLMNALPAAKSQLAQKSMGLAGRLPLLPLES